MLKTPSFNQYRIKSVSSIEYIVSSQERERKEKLKIVKTVSSIEYIVSSQERERKDSKDRIEY